MREVHVGERQRGRPVRRDGEAVLPRVEQRQRDEARERVRQRHETVGRNLERVQRREPIEDGIVQMLERVLVQRQLA